MDEIEQAPIAPALRQRRRWPLVAGLVGLYAVTWIGGTRSHTEQLAAEARSRYDKAAVRDRWEVANLAANEQPVEPQTSPNGPKSGVDWTFPVAPGVLLADSWYVVGPLYGKGGVKVVLYYGIGSVVLLHLWGWIS